MIHIAITTGEPAGIGVDITLQALLGEGGGSFPPPAWSDVHFYLLGDAELLRERAGALGLGQVWRVHSGSAWLQVDHRPLAVPALPGKLNIANSPYVLALLDAAIAGCQAGRFHAMVTAPVQKSIINDAGIPFSGHTEYLAAKTRAGRVVMLLAGPQMARGGEWLRVALATTHLPLARVPAALSVSSLVETLGIIHHDLHMRFGIVKPRILVTGLNPHAGESGHLGREEIEVIAPAIAAVRAAGIDARGPYPADTVFQPRHLSEGDCVLAMYHDQGLAPLKYATFGQGINITLGLPMIRTSVDHGTALDLAATGRSDAGSMRQAIDAAIGMARSDLLHGQAKLGRFPR